MARVGASGPNSICPGVVDFQVPRPRLQSTRAVRLPSALSWIVYLLRSSGVRVVSCRVVAAGELDESPRSSGQTFRSVRLWRR
jgi:hypothetical protein